MKSNIGKITKDQIIKARKATSREMEIANSIGWTATHKCISQQKTIIENLNTEIK